MNIDPWFVTGFAEGEGAFTYQRTSTTVSPKFSIRQRNDYNDVVQAVADFFNVGIVYPCAARGKTQASAYYVVINRNDLPIVVEHFKKYPMVSRQKQKVFEVWAELVSTRQSVPRGKVRTIETELNLLARKLTSLNMRQRGFIKKKKKVPVVT